ncbi:hypothetical protein MTO96_045962 [Rhipicephalus appendiculatus]
MLRCMKERMRNKFEYRFPVNERSVAATFRDPRFRNFTMLEDCVTANEMTSVQILTSQVEKHVKSPDFQCQHVARNENSENTLAVQAKRHFSSNSENDNQLASECRVLIGPKSLELGDNTVYWSMMQTQVPHLACLAREVLCVAATSTHSERVFSNAGLIFRAKRASLHPATVDTLAFVHDNYDVCKGCVAKPRHRWRSNSTLTELVVF